MVEMYLRLLKAVVNDEIASRKDLTIKEVLWCPGPNSHPVNIWPLLKGGTVADLSVITEEGHLIRVGEGHLMHHM